MQHVVSNIMCNDTMTPIKAILSERQRRKNKIRLARGQMHSLYRDILFLSFVALGRNNIDHGGYCCLLSVSQSVCLSVCLSVHPFVRLSIGLIFRPVCLLVRPSVCLLVRPSVCPSVCLFICPSIHLLVCLSIRPSVRPSICLCHDPFFKDHTTYRWSRAQTIQVWTGIFSRTMIKTIKHIGHKTSISVGLIRAASGLERIVPRIYKGSGVGWFEQMTISPILIG